MIRLYANMQGPKWCASGDLVALVGIGGEFCLLFIVNLRINLLPREALKQQNHGTYFRWMATMT